MYLIYDDGKSMPLLIKALHCGLNRSIKLM